MRGGPLSKYPRSVDEIKSDLRTVIEARLLPDYVPAAPPLSRRSIIRTQGSCFAENLAKGLIERHINATYLNLVESANSPLANLFFFQYLTGQRSNYLHPSHRGLAPRAVLDATNKAISSENAFIFTLGLAPAIFQKGLDVPVFDVAHLSDQHEMRHTSVAQNVGYIRDILGILRSLNPTMTIVLTLSPVPLQRAFIPNEPAIVTDCVSKATLRAAVAEIMNGRPAGVYYWPSFEIVRWLAPHGAPAYGDEDGSPRHVNKALVAMIVDLFMKYFIVCD